MSSDKGENQGKILLIAGNSLTFPAPLSQRPLTINARTETVGTARSFREPFKKRRCLVPASGFYESWRIDEKKKHPFTFDLANGKMIR